MKRIRVPAVLHEFGSVLVDAGHQCWLVGGATRDFLLGKEAGDFDIATDAPPERVISLFKRVIPTGIQHGTVTVIFKSIHFEVTTFRADGSYSDSRRPDSVRYAASVEEDLSRRDFTMNAIALELCPKAGGEGRMVDLFGGEADIARGLVRAIGDPMERFDEDGLRPLRALRFASQLDFEIDGATLSAIGASREKVGKVAVERIREELSKLLLGPGCARALHLMEDSGILGLLLPEISGLRGVEQKGYHDFDVLDHTIYSVEGAPRKLAIKLAALFHDAGKKRAFALGEDGIPSFHRHEEYSAEICSESMKRLRYANAEEKEVCHLVRQHMFHYTADWSDAAVRRFVARVGEENLEDLFALRAADSYGQKRKQAEGNDSRIFRERIEEVLAKDHALGIKDLAVKGDDLAAAGITKGPAMGRVLAELLESVLDDPSLNSKASLIGIAQMLWESKYKPL